MTKKAGQVHEILSEKQIRRLEHLYLNNILTIKEIRQLFGLSAAKLDFIRAHFGWPSRAPGGAPGPASVSAPAMRRDPAGRLADLQQRTQALLEQQIAEIETELHRAGEATERRTTADKERDARTLSILTRTMEKLCDLERAVNPAATVEKSEPAATQDRSLDEIRNDLERRLARLVEEEDA